MTTTLAQSGLSAPSDSGGRIKRLEALIFGPPGTWKTVTAHGMPRTRTIDFDDGMQSVEWAIRAGKLKKDPSEIVYETILGGTQPEKALQRAVDTVDGWIADEDISPDKWDRPYPQFWDTLIIDSASFMTQGSIWLAVHENKRVGLSKTLEDMKKGKKPKELSVLPMKIQDWGSANNLFMQAITQWKALGKNLIVIAHEYEKTTDEGFVVAVQPMVTGQLRNLLPASFDEVWYSKIEGQKDKAKAKFQLAPDSRRELKSRLGCLGAETEADFYAMRDVVAKFYGVPADRLWTAYHGSEGVERAKSEQVKEAVSI